MQHPDNLLGNGTRAAHHPSRLDILEHRMRAGIPVYAVVFVKPPILSLDERAPHKLRHRMERSLVTKIPPPGEGVREGTSGSIHNVIFRVPRRIRKEESRQRFHRILYSAPEGTDAQSDRYRDRSPPSPANSHY
jgi:hypothetical protein